jgi:hypothetical protein
MSASPHKSGHWDLAAKRPLCANKRHFVPQENSGLFTVGPW